MSYIRFYYGGSTSYWSRSSGSSDAFASEAMAGLLALAVILLVLAVYGIVRCIALVVHVLRHHPQHRGLRVLVACCLGSWAVAGLAAAVVAGAGAGPPSATATTLLVVLFVVAALITTVLLIAAKVVDLEGQDLFQRELTKETLLDEVLHQPWWETDAA